MINGDSLEYNLLAKWVDQLDVVSKDFITTVEIGVREGYGSHVICEVIKGPHIHIGIDPWGDIQYKHLDGKEGYLEYWKDEQGNMMKSFNIILKQSYSN